MNKKLVIAFLLGWALSLVVSPGSLLGMFRKKSS